MLHPSISVRYVSHEVGYGLVADTPIPRGSVTWAQDPLELSLPVESVLNMPSILRDAVRHFGFAHDAQNIHLNWDNTRYMNHSCNANTFGPQGEFEIAIRDIAQGEAVTCDYFLINDLCVPFSCKCDSLEQIPVTEAQQPLGAPEPGAAPMQCRGDWCNPLNEHAWAKLTSNYQQAILEIHRVPQPLAAIVQPEWIERACVRAEQIREDHHTLRLDILERFV